MDEATSTTKVTLSGECDETLLHLSHLTHVQLQALAVQKGKQSYLSAHWNAHIFLPLHPLRRGDETALLYQDPKDIDVCSYLDGNAGFANKLYFSPKAYPPITEEDSDVTITEKFDAVDALIKSKAKDAGSPVVIGQSKMKFAKSTKKIGDLFRVYLCGHCNSNGMRGGAGAVAEGSRVDKVAVPDDKYRETNVVSNVKGKARRTGSGRSAKGLHRRRNKALRVKACPFRFRLRVDKYGFFISLFADCGSSLHEGHPRFDPNFIPTQLSSLAQEERKDAQTRLPKSSQDTDNALQDDTILLESIKNIRGDCISTGFEKILDDAHQAMSVNDVESAISGGSTHRAAFYPKFNELTDLLEQQRDPELSREVEARFDSIIDFIHQSIGEQGQGEISITTS